MCDCSLKPEPTGLPGLVSDGAVGGGAGSPRSGSGNPSAGAEKGQRPRVMPGLGQIGGE